MNGLPASRRLRGKPAGVTQVGAGHPTRRARPPLAHVDRSRIDPMVSRPGARRPIDLHGRRRCSGPGNENVAMVAMSGRSWRPDRASSRRSPRDGGARDRGHPRDRRPIPAVSNPARSAGRENYASARGPDEAVRVGHGRAVGQIGAVRPGRLDDAHPRSRDTHREREESAAIGKHDDLGNASRPCRFARARDRSARPPPGPSNAVPQHRPRRAGIGGVERRREKPGRADLA